MSIWSCIKCYERDGEERVLKVTYDKATGKWSYENKCHLVKCKKPPEIELGMDTLLETASSIHCGQWVKYAYDPGYSFADKVMENAKCMSIREGSLVEVYTSKWDGGAKFMMPKCISSTDKHGKDNSLSIGTGIGGILAACLLVAAGICAYR